MPEMLSQKHLPIAERRHFDINGTVMAFDFGEKRIGVAVGETEISSTHPIGTLNCETNQQRFNAIQSVIDEWQPKLLLVGLPSYLTGDEHQLTQLSKRFAQRLEGRFNLPTMMVDERLSSAQASQQLTEAGIKGQAQKVAIDAVSAQVILQSYFDQAKANT